MDNKAGDSTVDDRENLQIIDWQQSGAPLTALAMEADGTWDVKEEDHYLIYARYEGPERRNMPEGGGQGAFNAWNVVTIWQASYLRATKIAEVFALGSTMWMLLSQVVQGFDEVEHPDDVKIYWAGWQDIPADWIEMDERCMYRDPNNRPAVVDFVQFWRVAELQ